MRVGSQNGPVSRGQRGSEEAGHSRLVGGSLTSKGTYPTRLVLGRSPHPPARVLTVYTEALPGFRHVYHPHGLHGTLLSQACVLETALVQEERADCTFQEHGTGEEPPTARGHHFLSMTSSNNVPTTYCHLICQPQALGDALILRGENCHPLLGSDVPKVTELINGFT